jgi:hypothetical protein
LYLSYSFFLSRDMDMKNTKSTCVFSCPSNIH